jgi:thiol-disulfide isomerase/thioredoxin
MRNNKFILLFIFIPFIAFSQAKPFEIFGTITGEYHSKMYLFFEGNYKQRDSISSEIKDGKFYFKGSIPMPVQARLHMDQRSFIGDFYLDNNKTYINCDNIIKIYNNGQDTMNMLSITSVKGSATDKLRSDFEVWLADLNKSGLSEGEKMGAYYDKLYQFIRKHPKSKVSPYLLGKASPFFYSQVKELSTLIDPSLDKSFEQKSVDALLNQLDKSKNKVTGADFHDFIFHDSSGHEINTNQLRGKYTLIVCWASWCKPCRAEHPELNALYEKYKDKGLMMIGISIDKEKEKWTQALVKDKLQWTQIIDTNASDGEFARYYDIEAIPMNFLLDENGKILGVGLSSKEIEELIVDKLK